MDALNLAEKFIDCFKKQVSEFEYPDDIFCGCGIAFGPVETFYPDSSPVDYDAYGRGIVLAVRYESMRKSVLEALNLQGNILILSETVFENIESNKKQDFSRFDCKKHDVWVRDDDDATCLYYKVS